MRVKVQAELSGLKTSLWEIVDGTEDVNTLMHKVSNHVLEQAPALQLLQLTPEQATDSEGVNLPNDYQLQQILPDSACITVRLAARPPTAAAPRKRARIAGTANEHSLQEQYSADFHEVHALAHSAPVHHTDGSAYTNPSPAATALAAPEAAAPPELQSQRNDAPVDAQPSAPSSAPASTDTHVQFHAPSVPNDTQATPSYTHQSRPAVGADAAADGEPSNTAQTRAASSQQGNEGRQQRQQQQEQSSYQQKQQQQPQQDSGQQQRAEHLNREQTNTTEGEEEESDDSGEEEDDDADEDEDEDEEDDDDEEESSEEGNGANQHQAHARTQHAAEQNGTETRMHLESVLNDFRQEKGLDQNINQEQQQEQQPNQQDLHQQAQTKKKKQQAVKLNKEAGRNASQTPTEPIDVFVGKKKGRLIPDKGYKVYVPAQKQYYSLPEFEKQQKSVQQAGWEKTVQVEAEGKRHRLIDVYPGIVSHVGTNT